MPSHDTGYDYEARQDAFRRRWLSSGKASDYIHHAAEVIQPGDKVLLRCRVSGWVQARNQNLADQETNLRQAATKLGVIVVGVDRHVGSGWDVRSLGKTAIMARQRGATIILAESVDRFVRNPLYAKKRQNLQARACDLQELKDWTDGLVLATIVHPDASPFEVRSFQRRRGQQMKGNSGGRPRIIDSQQELLARVWQLWRTLPRKSGGRGRRKGSTRPSLSTL